MSNPGSSVVAGLSDLMSFGVPVGFPVHQDVINEYRNAMVDVPADIQPILTQADNLLNIGGLPMIRDATRLVDEAIAISTLDTSMFLLWWQCALCKLVARRFTEAIKEFETAFTKLCGPMEFFHMYGFTLYAVGRWRDAASMFDKAIQLAQTPPSPQTQMLPAARLMTVPMSLLRSLRTQCENYTAMSEMQPAFVEGVKRELSQMDLSGMIW